MPPSSRRSAVSPSLVLTSSVPLSKEQTAFNTLIKKIDARRATLADWGTEIARFRQRYVSDLLPRQDEELDQYIALARSLDLACGQKGVTKVDRRKLSAVIIQIAGFILERREDDEIKALYNQHSDSDFDAEEAAQQDSVKSMLEEMLGMDLGDDIDLSSPEEVMRRVQQQFEAQGEAAQAEPKPRKKTARQLAREAHQEAEEKQMSQSIRDVYRKLASALHPDREPDPAERERKTALMQRVNEAYEKGNLLQLLELQLQLEHIDQAHLATLGGERLKHYIKILKGQLEELEMEIRHIKHGLAAEFGISPYGTFRPKDLLRMLDADRAQCERNIRQAKDDVETANDPKLLKAWLRTITLRQVRAPDFNLF